MDQSGLKLLKMYLEYCSKLTCCNPMMKSLRIKFYLLLCILIKENLNSQHLSLGLLKATDLRMDSNKVLKVEFSTIIGNFTEKEYHQSCT